MSKVFCIVTRETISVTYPDGKDKRINKTVHAGTPEFDLVKECIKEGREGDIPDVIDPAVRIATFSEGFIKVENGIIYIDDKPVPIALSQRILDYEDEGLPYQVLINFTRRLRMNPSYASVQALFRFLESGKFPLTPDGYFIAYKVVNQDMKDLHTGTFDNSVGQTPSMPRNEVDDDRSQSCSNGLHIASHRYATNFYGSGVLVEVKVDPQHVVEVPTGEDEKMRVCEYEVVAIAGTIERPEPIAYNYDSDDEDEKKFCDAGLHEVDSEYDECVECVANEDADSYCDTCGSQLDYEDADCSDCVANERAEAENKPIPLTE